AFSFRTARAGSYRVSAPGTSITVRDAAGNTLVAGTGQVVVRSPRARTSFSLTITPVGGIPVATYSLAIAPLASGRGGFHRPSLARPRPRPHAALPALRTS